MLTWVLWQHIVFLCVSRKLVTPGYGCASYAVQRETADSSCTAYDAQP